MGRKEIRILGLGCCYRVRTSQDPRVQLSHRESVNTGCGTYSLDQTGHGGDTQVRELPSVLDAHPGPPVVPGLVSV